MKNLDISAVVVAAAGHAAVLKGRPAPLARVAGLSVIGRLVNAARRNGAGALRLVLEEGDSHAGEIAEEAKRAWKESGPFRTVFVPAGESECGAVRRAGEGAEGDLLVMFADLALDPGLIHKIVSARRDSRSSAVLVVRESSSEYKGIALLPAALLYGFSEGRSLEEALLEMAPSGKVDFLDAGSAFSLRLREPGDIARAARLQVRALRRDTDGIVSRFLNRPVSLFLSLHFFSKMPLTPNQITFLAAAIGWVGIWLVFSWKGYWWTLAGTFLFHVSSVLDGCDGEVARLRFQFSRFGEWFDNVLDEVNNSLFIAAIGVGVWRTGGADYYLWGAIFHLVAVATVDSATFHQLIRHHGGSGKIDHMRWFFQRQVADAPGPKKQNIIMQFVRRDFYILLLLLFAAAGALQYGFWMTILADLALFPVGLVQWFWQTGRAGRRKLSAGGADDEKG